MCGFDTRYEEAEILRKNLNVVRFLSQSSNENSNFTAAQWNHIYTSRQGIVEYSVNNTKYNFHKKITQKGHHGHSAVFLELVDCCSVGLASRDLPFGIIPAAHRPTFAAGIQKIYPHYEQHIIDKIASDKTDLILCVIKGFKPRGDDNRPDRGVLPLAAMLTSTHVEVMTYIYGPVIAKNLNLLVRSPKELASANGLWKSVLSLSNYVALDVPVLDNQPFDAELLIDTSVLKESYTAIAENHRSLTCPVFSSTPQEYHEDDVDTGVHFIFSHLLRSYCFEGMCNPPGGDWSGLSLLYDDYEVRWLSLPRVSEEVNGKRPDHVLELFGVFDRPVLLSIESKEVSADLEVNVGVELINYVQNLMSFVPNVARQCRPTTGPWQKAKLPVIPADFEMISAAAYLKHSAQNPATVFRNSNCDMLFIMEPTRCSWNIEIIPKTPEAIALKAFIQRKVLESGFHGINIS